MRQIPGDVFAHLCTFLRTRELPLLAQSYRDARAPAQDELAHRKQTLTEAFVTTVSVRAAAYADSIFKRRRQTPTQQRSSPVYPFSYEPTREIVRMALNWDMEDGFLLNADTFTRTHDYLADGTITRHCHADRLRAVLTRIIGEGPISWPQNEKTAHACRQFMQTAPCTTEHAAAGTQVFLPAVVAIVFASLPLPETPERLAWQRKIVRRYNPIQMFDVGAIYSTYRQWRHAGLHLRCAPSTIDQHLDRIDMYVNAGHIHYQMVTEADRDKLAAILVVPTPDYTPPTGCLARAVERKLTTKDAIKWHLLFLASYRTREDWDASNDPSRCKALFKLFLAEFGADIQISRQIELCDPRRRRMEQMFGSGDDGMYMREVMGSVTEESIAEARYASDPSVLTQIQLAQIQALVDDARAAATRASQNRPQGTPEDRPQ